MRHFPCRLKVQQDQITEPEKIILFVLALQIIRINLSGRSVWDYTNIIITDNFQDWTKLD